MNEETVKISEREYRILTRIAYLLSDNIMAEKNEGFKKEMNIDIEYNKKEMERLINEWEHME